MIVGCKKTLVESRGWVNRNRYYLRNPIRMGGLFSRNDFVQRLTRPEYFPIATSPQKPHHTAIPHNSHHHTPQSNHTSPPQITQEKSISKSSTLKFSPISPNLTHTLPFLSPFIYTFSKNPLNSP